MDKEDRRELRNKIICILLSALILLVTALIFYISISMRHPGLLIFVGMASIAFFYRALFYKTPEQRKALREAKARREEERRQWEHHRFYPVSKRARAAYLILCLEEALRFYGQDPQEWEWVLKKLWEVTTTDSEEDWIFDIGDLLPGIVLPYADYEDLEKQWKVYQYGYSEEQFTFLRDLYRGAGPALEGIEALMDHIYDVITEDWSDGETPHTPPSLQYIDRAEQLLREKGISLPHDEQALSCLISQKDKSFGKPFDGLRFSILLKNSY